MRLFGSTAASKVIELPAAVVPSPMVTVTALCSPGASDPGQVVLINMGRPPGGGNGGRIGCLLGSFNSHKPVPSPKAKPRSRVRAEACSRMLVPIAGPAPTFVTVKVQPTLWGELAGAQEVLSRR